MNMRRFKLRTGRNPVYDLTRENYRELTKKKSIYTGYGQDGRIRNFAVCPVCDNPIQIIGLYKQVKNTPDPYGNIIRNQSLWLNIMLLSISFVHMQAIHMF